MTEAEWLACNEPHKMLEFLRAGNASDRRFWLFVSVCAREIRPFLPENRELSVNQEDPADLWERYADGQLTELDVKRAFRARMKLPLEPPLSPPWRAARSGVFEVMFWFAPRGTTEYPRLCEIVRDIFGNPVRPTTANPSWLTPNVVELAQTIYDGRAFDRLPILAESLEETGCDNADILAHCREPGAHVRGCWAVDMLLGKE